MTQALSAEEKARMKKQWTELAVKLAQEGQWAEAVNVNKNIINLFPSEPDALNRLGKAHSELGQYTEARQAYSQTLKYSPDNIIAKKNLDRLALMPDTVRTGVAPTGVAPTGVDLQIFIEETGKSGVTELINLAPSSMLVRIGAGDKVNLHADGHRLLVKNAAGDYIGQVEPRLANRLIGFIAKGNRYGAAILIPLQGVIRIREEYQHPSMFNQVSFPSQGANEKDTVRAYIKDSMLRYDRDDEDDLGNDDEYYDGGDDADEMTEVDFESGSDSDE
ncbi:tetratricopeptide repeat protein [Tengunoibacter tsumagoiensis]|uniref:Uncharacterized protein n=1 Tax=Tengunoibacter tsumagoiensis TaxID=2014871 RepID=A0A402A073_9CHLR|nr:tetratricopeptide repeat protein [Tengunoibacter tsumagoiensis]GCE12548.1 hypothetical protein KTT_24070 [Tengunoibacter tsumagoiensis]